MVKNIMTVDDSASVRMMVGHSLREAGFGVMEAANGREALDMLETEPVHLVIADVNMPVMDGISMVKEMRTRPRHKFTPVIMLTTESEEGMKRKGREAGATGWMVKPFCPEQLLAVIRKVLG